LSAFFGRDDLAKIIFIAFATLYPVALATIEGVRAIAKSQYEVADVYGFTPRQALFRLILPAASPQIISGLHLGLIFAWLATMGAEFLLASTGEGLGMTVIRGRAAFRVDLILFGMLIIGTFGMLLNELATRAETCLLHWRGHTR
jgi:sulfonate transport system permease protein